MRKIILLGMSWVLSGCLGAPPIDEQSSEIVGGTVDNGDPGVVLLIHQKVDGTSTCTGSLITPTVILTAAHCTDGPPPGGQDSYLAFFGTDGQKMQGQTEKVIQIVPHPQYDGDSRDHDVGVMILAKPVAVPPLTVNMQPLAKSVEGADTRLVGFGRTDATTSGTSRIKRQVVSEIQRVEPNLLYIGAPGKQACAGDSGGPALLKVGGKEMIVGTVSGGESSCTTGGYHTRVDVQGAFLSKYLPAPSPPPPPPPADAGDSGAPDAGTAADAGPVADASPPGARPPVYGPPPGGGGCSVAHSSHHESDVLFLMLALAAGLLRRRRESP
jgi:secreted trypsin-like serine protease